MTAGLADQVVVDRALAARRVGLLTYALDRATGGIARYTHELQAVLLRHGLPLTTLQAGRSNSRLDGTAPSQFGRTVRLPGAGLLPVLMTLGQVEIGLAARALGLELVHDPTGVSPLMLTPARRVATIHDVIPLIHPSASTLLDRLIYQSWLPLVAPSLDAIITVSAHSRRDIVRKLDVDPARVHVVPNAVSPSFRRVDRATSSEVAHRHGIAEPYVLYVGSIEARKNLDRLLGAFARLRAWSPQWQLVVVGAAGWKSSPVFATVQRLGLGSSVRFTGFVPDPDLPALFSGADLFVFPSLYEGFGLPVLEAMACGTPVVTSSTSSLPEIAGDAALLCDPEDESAITEAMRRVLDDPDLRRELSDRGVERARSFGWDRTAQDTLRVYHQVLDERPRRRQSV
jgi:glycosyltransferase involved in cell wall biosynthesis